MRNFIREFREFAARGMALDMGVGIILGNAFSAIVTSLVNDVILPLISGVTIKTTLADLKFTFTKYDSSVVTVNYGLFIQAVIDFVIMALCVFIMIKAFNKLKKAWLREKVVEEVKKQSDETIALREIIDILKKR